MSCNVPNVRSHLQSSDGGLAHAASCGAMVALAHGEELPTARKRRPLLELMRANGDADDVRSWPLATEAKYRCNVR